MVHALKEHPEHFENVISGKKLFEIRKNDRDYKTGDLLALNEYDPETKKYTGRCCVVFVCYILSDGKYCLPGHVAMSIKPCRVGTFPHFDPFKNCDYYSVQVVTKAYSGVGGNDNGE